MVTRTQGLLTEIQRKELLSFEKLGAEEFNSYFSLSVEDIKLINKHRGNANRIGFAVQLCLVRYPGVSLSDDFFLPQFFLEYIGAQLEIPITEYQYYGKGKNTMLNHLAEICDFYNYQEYTISSFNLLTEILEEAVKENFDELYLIQLAIQELRKNRILLPPLIDIERLVRSIRNDNEKNLYLEIYNTLSERQKEHLEQLLLIGEGNRSKLAWLKDISGKANKETAIITCL